MKVLVTGITGFLGSELLRLMRNDHHQYYCLVRRQSLQKLINQTLLYSNIIPVVGDLTSQSLINAEENTFDVRILKEEIDVILHAGALYDLQSSREDCYMQNVIGTQNIINFARYCPNLKNFHYVSTIAVAGDAKGIFKENELVKGQKFTDFYSESKYRAEQLVRGLKIDNVTVTIYRPGIIIANSRDWKVANINGPYYLFNVLKKLKPYTKLINLLPMILLPHNKKASFPIIPVDDVARVIYRGLTMNESENGNTKTYHIVASNCPSVGVFLERTFNAYNFHGKIESLRQSKLSPCFLKALSMPTELLRFMYADVIFDTEEMNRKFPEEVQDFQVYADDFYKMSLNV